MIERHLKQNDEIPNFIEIKGKNKKIEWDILANQDLFPNKAFIFEKLNYFVDKINKLDYIERTINENNSQKFTSTKVYMKKRFNEELKKIDINKEYLLSMGKSMNDIEYKNLITEENKLKSSLENIKTESDYRQELFLSLLPIFEANGKQYKVSLNHLLTGLKKDKKFLDKECTNTDQINQDIQKIEKLKDKNKYDAFRIRTRKFLKSLDLDITNAQEKKLTK